MNACMILFVATMSVYDFATNSIAVRIAGAEPAVCLSRFADYPSCFAQSEELNKDNHSSLITPNSSLDRRFWLKDVDFSCVSPWNDSCGYSVSQHR